jgi:N terminus of Rad21 / Rec8 like protein
VRSSGRSWCLSRCRSHNHARGADTIIHQTFNHQKVPLALRLSGQLLLGVVRIYTRKLDFLQRDSAEALVKIRQVCLRKGALTCIKCILALLPVADACLCARWPTPGVPARDGCGLAPRRADCAAGEHHTAGAGLRHSGRVCGRGAQPPGAARVRARPRSSSAAWRAHTGGSAVRGRRADGAFASPRAPFQRKCA